ncbi:unnamed protein product, partial [Polarella glacialis]
AGKLADEVARIAVAKGVLRDASREEDLARFLRVVCVNAHTIPRIQGIMLFYWLSMFSHSCAPNATYSTDLSGGGLACIVARPRALQHIAAGEIISVTYLSLQMLLSPRGARQELLRVQKGFVCACGRCSGPDEIRVLPCPTCRAAGRDSLCFPAASAGSCSAGLPLTMTGAVSDMRWSCRSCGEIEADRLPLECEERLLGFLLGFDPPDEQTVHSLRAVISADLMTDGPGSVAGSCVSPSTMLPLTAHFLFAWLQLILVRLLLRRVEAPASKDSGENGACAARAAAALRPLQAWVALRAPNCLYLLAVEFAVPAVRGLLRGGRAEEAGQLAASFEAQLAAAYGHRHPDVRFLGDASACRRCYGGPPQSSESGGAACEGTSWVASCDACGVLLATQGVPAGSAQAAPTTATTPALTKTTTATTATTTATTIAATTAATTTKTTAATAATTPALPQACWCARCGLAPYCSPGCEVAGRAAHRALCVSSEGLLP